MAVVGLPWYDFVVWTLKDVFVERIQFDAISKERTVLSKVTVILLMVFSYLNYYFPDTVRFEHFRLQTVPYLGYI